LPSNATRFCAETTSVSVDAATNVARRIFSWPFDEQA
jgi:hypothetical protein